MSGTPRSPHDKVGGMIYFARMLDKIRLHARGELRADCHANLGLRMGGDGLCCAFLRVAYADLKTRVLGGGTDEEILDWCFQQGRKPSEVDLLVWNEFGRKLGWNDRATPVLDKLKAESGLAGRNDIVTLFDYTDVDECRKS